MATTRQVAKPASTRQAAKPASTRQAAAKPATNAEVTVIGAMEFYESENRWHSPNNYAIRVRLMNGMENLVAFVSVEDLDTGICYNDLRVFASANDGDWFLAPPARQYQTSDGQTKYAKYYFIPSGTLLESDVFDAVSAQIEMEG